MLSPRAVALAQKYLSPSEAVRCSTASAGLLSCHLSHAADLSHITCHTGARWHVRLSADTGPAVSSPDEMASRTVPARGP